MAHARFETLMLVPEELAERRRRLMIGALMAATLSMSMGVMSWTAGKLGITSVTPPKHTYSVTLQVLEPPPPPAAPPALPAGAKAEDTQKAAAPDEPVPPEPDEAPTEVVPIDLDARPQARLTVPSAAGGGAGNPAGAGPGIVGIGSRCLLPPCLGTQQVVGRPAVPRPEEPVVQPVHAPIKTVMAMSVFTPDPDQSRLSRTATGRTHRSPGKTTVSFCIDGNGKTYDVRTRRGFSGDTEVDEICRTTVARWRFSPQRVGGKVRSTCSAVTFDIRFE
jgi:outer membrane biosynthesis protein TonB